MGYERVHLRVDNKSVKLFVHRLVFLTFIGAMEVINHIDENKTNNRLSNLEASNPSHNANHSLGLEFSLKDPTGRIHTFKGISKFCDEHGLCRDNIYKVKSGKRKSHKGWTLPT